MPISTMPVARWKKHNFNDDKYFGEIQEDGTVKKKRRKSHNDKWDDRFYLQVYQLTKLGKTNKEVAEAIGVDEHTLKKWKAHRPALAEAFDEGMKRSEQTFADYVFDRLPPKLQETWQQLQRFEENPNALKKITSLMANQGIRARQHLFIQALISKNFNASKAISSLGMSYGVLMQWARNDPNFSDLLNEIEWHRKNFYEDSLFELVKEKNPAATIFVNKTKNKDRGYGAKLEVEHSGSIEHQHRQVLDLDKLNLPFDLRKQLLDHIAEQEVKALPAPTDAIDVNFEVLNDEEENDAA